MSARRPRCLCIKKDGEQCKNQSKPDSPYCGVHKACKNPMAGVAAPAPASSPAPASTSMSAPRKKRVAKPKKPRAKIQQAEQKGQKQQKEQKGQEGQKAEVAETVDVLKYVPDIIKETYKLGPESDEHREFVQKYKPGPTEAYFSQWSRDTAARLLSGEPLYYHKLEPKGLAKFARLHSYGYEYVLYKDTGKSVSIVSGMPFLEDDDYDENGAYVKLKTCLSSCTNSGIYAKTELDDYINKSNGRTCLYCGEPFSLSAPTLPPYGTVMVSMEYKMQDMGYRWILVSFAMKEGVSEDGEPYTDRMQTAYIPYTDSALTYSMLALWLLLTGFEHSKVFSLGISVTNERFGIVFSDIHIKTGKRNTHGHGYQGNPIKHFLRKDGVLDTMIAEAASVGIYTPRLIDLFNTDGATSDVQRDICRMVISMLDDVSHDRLEMQKGEGVSDPCKLVQSVLGEDVLKGRTMADVGAIHAALTIGLENIQYILDSKYAAADVIHHEKQSPMMSKYIDGIRDWNKLGYTQLNDLGKRCTWKSDTNRWSVHSNRDRTLFDVAKYKVSGSRADVLVFHGTTVEHLDSIKANIDWRLGDGALGKGFYFTLNPNEAKGYACNQSLRGRVEGKKREHNQMVIVLECIVHDADKFELTIDKYNESDQKVVRNNRHAAGTTWDKHAWSYQDQFRGRQLLIDQIDIVRAHIVGICDLSQPFVLSDGKPGTQYVYDTYPLNLPCHREHVKYFNRHRDLGTFS